MGTDGTGFLTGIGLLDNRTLARGAILQSKTASANANKSLQRDPLLAKWLTSSLARLC
jgi:hypothetical protein